MKKSKIILIVLAIIVAIPVVIVGIILSFVTEAENYQKEQDKYFEKVEYYFCGKMHSYKILDYRPIYLIEIDVDSALFVKNNISYNDNFFGLYSKTQNKIFFNAYFDIGNRTNKRVINDTLPYVRVNSSNRTIEYITNNETKYEKLSISGFYKRDLEQIETKDMIRF